MESVGTTQSPLGYGSDVAVELLGRLGYTFVAENPGASLRGLHARCFTTRARRK